MHALHDRMARGVDQIAFFLGEKSILPCSLDSVFGSVIR
jgi:hypothetical protein